MVAQQYLVIHVFVHKPPCVIYGEIPMHTHQLATDPLDPSFGDRGSTHVPFQAGGGPIGVSSVALAEDGRSFFGCTSFLPSSSEFGCFCLDADGHLIEAFGDKGYVSGQFNDSGGRDHSVTSSILLQSIDNALHVVLMGIYYVPDVSSPKLALARFNDHGMPDTSFGNNGTIVHDLPSRSGNAGAGNASKKISSESTGNSSPAQAILLPDNRIVLVYSYAGAAHIVRLESNGALDLTFNSVGYVVHTEPDAGVELVNILQTTDGNYLCAGHVKDSANVYSAIFVKVDQAGHYDNSFGTNGRVDIREPNGANFFISHIARQGNNRILAIGESSTLTTRYGLLISLEPDGKFNIQFNSAQPLQTQVDGHSTNWSSGTIRPDGKLVIAGTADSPGTTDRNVVFARFQANGALDQTFGRNGFLRIVDSHAADALAVFELDKALFNSRSSYQTGRVNKIWRCLLG